jgi:uncharacterized pyridoxamine 5'-phosphate oxidase family protein
MKMRRRVGRRGVKPTAIKSRHVPQDLIRNTEVSYISTTFNDGVTITLTSRFTSSEDANIRLSSMPFMIAIYEAASFDDIAPGTNQIPMDVATGRYTVTQLAMPGGYTVSGERFYKASGDKIFFASDNNDLIFKTSLANNSGSQQSVTFVLQNRLIQSRGGGGFGASS